MQDPQIKSEKDPERRRVLFGEVYRSYLEKGRELEASQREKAEDLIKELELSPNNEELPAQNRSKNIQDRLQGFEERRINSNMMLLERLIAQGSELKTFGSLLWRVASKLLTSATHPGARKIDRLLKNIELLPPAHYLIELLEKDPGAYPDLSNRCKELPEVREYAQRRPWVEVGLSKKDYETYKDCHLSMINWNQLPEHLKANKYLALKKVQHTNVNLRSLPDKLRSDRDIVLAAVTQSGVALVFASEELRADKDIVLAAVNNYAEAIEFASKELQENEDIL